MLKLNRNLWILIIVVVAAIIIGVSIYFYEKRKPNPPPPPPPNPPSPPQPIGPIFPPTPPPPSPGPVFPPEVYLYYPGQGMTSYWLAADNSASLPNGGQWATLAQLQNAFNNGLSSCMYGWVADDSNNVYLPNTQVPTKAGACGTQNSLNITAITAMPSSIIGIWVYGVKPSSSSSGACFNQPPGSGCIGVYPFQFGGGITQQWSQY